MDCRGPSALAMTTGGVSGHKIPLLWRGIRSAIVLVPPEKRLSRKRGERVTSSHRASAFPTQATDTKANPGAPIFASTQGHWKGKVKNKTLRGAAPVETPRQGDDPPAPAIFLLPSPACGRGAGGEGVTSSQQGVLYRIHPAFRCSAGSHWLWLRAPSALHPASLAKPEDAPHRQPCRE
jgi:hypothetical protein